MVKKLLLLILFITFKSLSAQDIYKFMGESKGKTKTTETSSTSEQKPSTSEEIPVCKSHKIFAAPEMSNILASPNGTIKGVSMGFKLGYKYYKHLNNLSSVLTGVVFNSNSYENWKKTTANKYDGFLTKSIFVEIPIGYKRLFTVNKRDFNWFAAVEYLNVLCLSSNITSSTTDINQINLQQQKLKGVYMLYNPGAQVEIGFLNHSTSNFDYSLSLSARTIYLNAFSSVKNDQTFLLSTAFNFGVAFGK